MLNDQVKELIAKSRIVSFDTWQDKYALGVIEIFQQADDEKRYLTDEDIDRLINLAPNLTASLESGKLLRENANKIVSQARGEVLAAYPDLTEPGGGLYPPMRAEACWRDFWQFLRCISYGISGQSVDYLSDRGLAYLEQLYQELNVPLNAMVLGLEQLKIYGLQRFEPSQQNDLAVYFDLLINAMNHFSNV